MSRRVSDRCAKFTGRVDGKPTWCGAPTSGLNVIAGDYQRPYRLCPEHLAEYLERQRERGYTRPLKERPCEGCGATMLVDHNLQRTRYLRGEGFRYERYWPLATRFCATCLPIQQKEAQAERSRRWRKDVKEREGETREWACGKCGKPLAGEVAYRWGWGTDSYRCAECEAEHQRDYIQRSHERSVEAGRPGIDILGRRIPALEGLDPLAGIVVAACEVCHQEVAPPYVIEQRREIVWCGEVGCRAEAERLSKRVPLKEARLCECGCGETFEPSRSDQRYATDACRARAWRRERMAG